jgi:type 1 glutamine amidotransferase
MLITGGCCHDYATQKDILKTGLEARANIEITQIHSDDSNVKPKLPIYGNPEYAKGYDLVIHDECSAGIADPETIAGVLKPHREDGIPAVNLHCAMHSYRFGDFQKPVAAGAENSHWFEFIGLQSARHGTQTPIAIHFTDKDSPITAGLEDWKTGPEELYNNVSILGAKPLATGKQMQPAKDKGGKKDGAGEVEVEAVVVWTNLYGPKKTRVFSTTIGHNNETVADSHFLDLVTRGLLWATGNLKEDGSPAVGFGPGGK